MRRRGFVVHGWLAVAGLLLTAMLVPPSAAQSGAQMDTRETAVLEELNLARTRPAEYAAYVEEHKKNYKGPTAILVDGRKFRTVEGLRAVDEAVGFLRQVAPAPPLAPARPLVLAARDHARDIGPRGETGHAGSDRSQPADRIGRYGTPRMSTGEAIAFGALNARAVVIQLIVDDGVPDRGHRKSVFEPAYRTAGVAIGPHRSHDYLVVIDFADQIDERR
jgi:uncharacterized protein YkwD